MKNTTITDVARDAKVSIATVSYVLNNRTDQKISDETRKKVLQIANLLGYKRNNNAYSLVSGGSCNIGIFTDIYSPIDACEISEFIQLCLKNFNTSNKLFNVIHLSDFKDTRANDAIILYNVSSSMFNKIADASLAPILAVDCLINNPLELFYQINCDYIKYFNLAKEHFNSEKLTLVIPNTHNIELREHILNIFDDVVFVSSSKDIIANIEKLRNCNPVIIGNFILDLMNSLEIKNAYFINKNTDSKVKAVIDTIEQVLDKDLPTSHHILTI